MEPFKNIYNENFFSLFTSSLKQVYPTFEPARFMDHIYDDEWEGRELKQRMRHITKALRKQLPDDFQESVGLIIRTIEKLKEKGIKEHSVEYMFFPDYIECYGLEHVDVSLSAIERITQFTSCEFAIRPFIIRYQGYLMEKMQLWSKHADHRVRRLASEGCRPRLPWAMALPGLKKDPSPIQPILENLKNDGSEFVRRSVANNLNDIAKDNPDLVIETVKRWKGDTKETDWIVKHASRTLLKQGNPELMRLFGFGSIDDIRISSFKVHTPKVQLGDYLKFSFRLENISEGPVNIRLEYGIYYKKANGSLSRKVFKISEKGYAANSTALVERKQHFKPITTRVYHAGEHQVSIIINGVEGQKESFEFFK